MEDLIKGELDWHNKVNENFHEVDSQMAEKANKGSGATIIIAASNASDNSKLTANYLCDGINDYDIIMNAINNLPHADFKTPVGVLNAPFGKIIFTEGVFKLNTKIVLPFGSHIIAEGMGRCYQDCDFGGNGGTIISSSDPHGILKLPFKTEWGDNITFIARDLDFRQDGELLASEIAVNCVGLMSGGLENIGVINDHNISGITSQQGMGLNLNIGAYGNTAFARDIDVGAFGQGNGVYCMECGANHLVMDNIHLNGGQVSNLALKITYMGDRFYIGSLHLFQFGKTDGSTALKLLRVEHTQGPSRMSGQIGNLSFESCYKGTTQTDYFIQIDDNADLQIDRIIDNNQAAPNLNLLYGSYDKVSVKTYCGTNKQAKGGFWIPTPAVPSITPDGTAFGQENKATNNYPFPMQVFIPSFPTDCILNIQDGILSNKTVGKPASFILAPGQSVFFTKSVPASWIWLGM
ncbi:hypothetical protein [Clostridium tyrobutyricum]|uniref:hypothetical protein n=1 Tax=Clostridium tyrobutyricum TaxID=1519 RepID=UPI00073D4D66|nr:hypothetical protein [Clostridium tyrobutyricum]